MPKEAKCGFIDTPGVRGVDTLGLLGPTLFVDIGFDPDFKPVENKPPTNGEASATLPFESSAVSGMAGFLASERNAFRGCRQGARSRNRQRTRHVGEALCCDWRNKAPHPKTLYPIYWGISRQ